MLSVMLLTACASTEPIIVEKIVVPELTFPTFPLADKMTDNKDGTTTVSSEWIVRNEEYHIKINSTEEEYNRLKRMYESFYGKRKIMR